MDDLVPKTPVALEEARPCSHPRLTFACELDRERLTVLFCDTSVIEDLQALGAHVLLMLSDLSSERAAVVKRLNAAGIPVVGAPYCPPRRATTSPPTMHQGQLERYDEWKAWTAEHGLVWEGVGLDIEPETRFYQQIMENPWGLAPMLLPRLRDTERPRRARDLRLAGLLLIVHGFAHWIRKGVMDCE
ncbi:MAG: hypothetical protein M3N09_08225 [Actinomycetota bacterium]|nr:hypothetical protein [Actinomycetota bacterium]